MAFGISGAALSSKIMQFRTLLLIIAFLLLVIAFYMAYKPAKSKNEGEHEPGTSNKKGKINFLTLNRILLWIVAVLTIAFAFMTKWIHLLPF
jgi:uncharacterized membrane protein YfcA